MQLRWLGAAEEPVGVAQGGASRRMDGPAPRAVDS